MDNHHCTPRTLIIASWLLTCITLLLGSHVQAQQAGSSAPFARAALASLHAIESDDTTSQDKSSETARIIDAAGQRAVTEKEISTTEMLRQIYRRRLQDNNLMKAYGKLMELDNAQDESEESVVKKRKDSAVSQFADVEAAIEKREESCYKQLEQSLAGRSSEQVRACSEWLKKANLSGND